MRQIQLRSKTGQLVQNHLGLGTSRYSARPISGKVPAQYQPGVTALLIGPGLTGKVGPNSPELITYVTARQRTPNGAPVVTGLSFPSQPALDILNGWTSTFGTVSAIKKI